MGASPERVLDNSRDPDKTRDSARVGQVEETKFSQVNYKTPDSRVAYPDPDLFWSDPELDPGNFHRICIRTRILSVLWQCKVV